MVAFRPRDHLETHTVLNQPPPLGDYNAFADDPMMQVSHETIYQALFVQGRGELARCLRTGRVKRRARRRPENTGQLRDMIVARFGNILGESKIPALDLAANYNQLG